MNRLFYWFLETFEKKEAITKGNYFAFHHHMQKEIRALYPQWTNEIDSNIYNSCFTSDMDGLLCSAFAKEHLGLEVNKFYDFRGLYQIGTTDQRETIFFDCAIREGKTFDNHLTRLGEKTYVNGQSANINNVTGIHLDRYTDKFAMSTLIQLYALYNVPLPHSLQGKLILLCCDVGFKAFYSDRFRPIFLSYLEMFNMLELVDVLEMYTIDQMYQFMLMAQMNMNIRRQNDGHLIIDMDSKNPYGAKWLNFTTGMELDWFSEHLGYSVELPKGKFKLIERFATKKIEARELPNYMDNVFSYAFINSKTAMISLRGESA